MTRRERRTGPVAYALAVVPILAGLLLVPWWPLHWWVWAVAAALLVVGVCADLGAARARRAARIADIRDIAISRPGGRSISPGHRRVRGV